MYVGIVSPDFVRFQCAVSVLNAMQLNPFIEVQKVIFKRCSCRRGLRSPQCTTIQSIKSNPKIRPERRNRKREKQS